MGRDAHAAETRRDIDVFAGQSLDKSFRHAIREAEAQDMRRAQLRVGQLQAKIAQPLGELPSASKALDDGRCAPSAIISMPIAAISIDTK